MADASTPPPVPSTPLPQSTPPEVAALENAGEGPMTAADAIEAPLAASPPIATASGPSPSTIPEPELPEPSAATSFGMLLLMIGLISAIAVVIVAIIAAGVFIVRSYGHLNRAVGVNPPVADSPMPPSPAPPAAVAPLSIAPPPAVAVPTTKPALSVEHGPFVTSMSTTSGNVDEPITLHGRGLATVEEVVLFPQHGGASVDTAVQSTDDRSVVFSVPAVEKPEGYQPGDGYYVGVFSKTGACLFVDSTFRSTTPTDTAGASHDAVRVKFNSPLKGGSHLLVFGDTGSTVSVGTDCIVLLRPNVLLKDYGGGCKIFYMPPLRGMTPDADGLTKMTDIRLSAKGSRLMLKPLGDPGLPPDPN